MKRILAILTVLFLASLHASAAITVMAQTNGVLASPTNFFTANSNLINAIVTGGGGGSDATKLTKTGDGIGGIFSLKTNLVFDGDTNAPNTNWQYNIFFRNLESFEVGQTATTSIYGKENLQLEGGIVTIIADTNLSFVTPNTLSLFTVPTNQYLLSLVGAPDANGNVPADFIPLDALVLTNTAVANKVAGYDSNRKLTKGTVDVTDVASAATLATVSGVASAAAVKANNLSDLTSATTAKSNLGLVAVASSGSASDLSAGTLAAARLPALTGGDVTSSAGSSVLTIPVGTVTDTKSALEVKPSCAVVAASNLTLSGEQTIDGVTTSGSLVLATAQSTASQNGPWLTAAGAWSRPTWFASGSAAQAPRFCSTFIRLGSTYQGSTWRMTTAGVTIDTTAQTWVQTPYMLNAGSVIGTLPAANNAAIPTNTGTGYNLTASQTGTAFPLTINDTRRAGSDNGYYLGNYYVDGGTNLGFANPYFRSVHTNWSTAFDVMPNGTPSAGAWIDIISEDGYNYAATGLNYLHLGSVGASGGYIGYISTKFFAGGGRSSPPLIMQDYGGDFYIRSLQASPISKNIQDATKHLWSYNNYDAIPFFANFRPNTNVVFGINDFSGGVILSATTESSVVTIPLDLYAKSFNVTLDGSTFPLTLTNNVTTIGTTSTFINSATTIGNSGAVSLFKTVATRNLFSFDGSLPTTGFFEIMPSASSLMLLDGVGAASRIGAFSTNFGAAQPLIIQALSLNFTRDGSGYDIVSTNGTTTIRTLIVTNFAVIGASTFTGTGTFNGSLVANGALNAFGATALTDATVTKLRVVTTTDASVPAPVMNSTQKNALTGIAGMTVYDSTLTSPSWYDGSAWLDLKHLDASYLAAGTLPTARLPAHTGDATSSAGSAALTVVALNGTSLAGLGTGILKNTAGTGVPSIATGADIPVTTGIEAFFFGDGSDGAYPNSGTTTLARDAYYSSMTVSGASVLVTAGYRVFVSGTLDITGASANQIVGQNTSMAGGAGNVSGAAGAASAAFAAATSGGVSSATAGTSPSGKIGGTGTTTTGSAGTASGVAQGGGGSVGASGAGGAGTAGTMAGGALAAGVSPSPLKIPRKATVELNQGSALLGGGQSGPGGGGGGGDGTAGGGGGGGGTGGAVVGIWAKTLTCSGAASGSISALGGNGGNGGTATAGNRGGGGGGSAGGGGVVYVLYETKTGSASNAINISGGNGGTGGSGFGSAGNTGGDGGAGGGSGTAIVVNITTGVITVTGTPGAAAVAGSAHSGLTGGVAGTGTVLNASL